MSITNGQQSSSLLTEVDNIIGLNIINTSISGSMQPYVQIIEQPARSAVRFRYECEGRSAGPIPGVSSNPQCATYPSIQVCNYKGRAMIVVSCVTSNPPYRQHPHHLVGRIGCHNGICTMIVDNSEMVCSFTHLGIQCAKRNEISSRLKQRKHMQIDPTRAGFDHINKSSRSIDLGVIRLSFQAFIQGVDGHFSIPLEPVISNPVYDKKLLSKLTITDMSTRSALITGGKVMIFCNYIDEEDIEVRFYECDHLTGNVIWEAIPSLKPPFGEIHKRVAISFLAPEYPDQNVSHPVNVWFQLRRPSDGESSEPIAFHYLPKCYPDCPLAKQYQMFHTRNADSEGHVKKMKSVKKQQNQAVDIISTENNNSIKCEHHEDYHVEAKQDDAHLTESSPQGWSIIAAEQIESSDEDGPKQFYSFIH